MKHAPKVSVILTSYNHAKYLRDAIDSVLSQTFSDFELIIWDDASTDESWQIITSYSDERIKSFRNDEQKRGIWGVNKAISKITQGDYIAIHHSDDVWEPQKLEKQVAFLDSNPRIGAVFTWAQVIDEDGRLFEDENHFYYKIFEQSNRSRYEWLNYFFYIGNALCHPSVLIRKLCYEDCGPYRYGLAQTGDFDMWVRLCLKYEVYVMPEKLVRFRVRANQENASASRQDNHIRSQFEYLQVLDNYRQLSSYEEMVKIFPAAEKYYRMEGFDPQFVLGMIALETRPFRFTELFGLRLLFETLNDPSRIIKINEYYHFDTKKFRELSGTHDIFSVELIPGLQTQVRETERQLAETERQLAEAETRLAEAETRLAEAERHWIDVQSGLTWKLVQKIRMVRERLIPIGSRRERLMRFILRVLFMFRREGIYGLLFRIRNRMLLNDTLKSILPAQDDVEELPRVSIIVPVFNALSLTQECVYSLVRETHNLNFEIIVVNNASKDKTLNWLNLERKKNKFLKIFSMEKNVGFGPAVNFGMRQSKGEFIVILNNDTIVTQGWLGHLLSAMEEDASIGIVGPVTNYVGEGAQIDENAKNLLPDINILNQYAKNIADRSGLIYEPSRLVFFCVMLKRELVDIVGGLDESYEKGNFEDDDYCLRVRMAGYKLAIAKNSFVYHHGSVTFKSNRISHTQFMEKNRERFYKKTGRIATASRPFLTWPVTKKNNISVIVRTKDRPFLLQRTLTSLANQTFRDFEIILVNDGGQDVLNLLDSFGDRFPVKYVSHEISKGRTAAVNIGIQHSKGKWLSYLDDDDIVYPWHLEVLFKAAENGGEKVFYSDYNRSLFHKAQTISPAILQGTPAFEYSHKELLVQNHIPIHTWMHHRDCIEKTGLWDESLDRLEDYEFLLRLSANYAFQHVKKVTCEYRYYMDSANSIYTDRYKTLDALEKIYERNPVDDAILRFRRQEVLDAVKRQIQQIQKIQGQIGVAISEETATREIIKLVVGM